MELKEILSHVDHTLLAQTATFDEIKQILDDGIKYGVASCCIPPSFVKRAKAYVGDKVKICTVIGFPNEESDALLDLRGERAERAKTSGSAAGMVRCLGKQTGAHRV